MDDKGIESRKACAKRRQRPMTFLTHASGKDAGAHIIKEE